MARAKRKYAGSASALVPVKSGAGPDNMDDGFKTRCVYTKIQLKLLETDVEDVDGVEELKKRK